MGTSLLMRIHKPLEIIHRKPTLWCSRYTKQNNLNQAGSLEKIFHIFLIPNSKVARFQTCKMLNFVISPHSSKTDMTYSDTCGQSSHWCFQRNTTFFFSLLISKARLQSGSSQDSLSQMKNITQAPKETHTGVSAWTPTRGRWQPSKWEHRNKNQLPPESVFCFLCKDLQTLKLKTNWEHTFLPPLQLVLMMISERI